MLRLGVWMKNKKQKEVITYTNEPLGKIKVIEDFLPSPQDLVKKDNLHKTPKSITLANKQ